VLVPEGEKAPHEAIALGGGAAGGGGAGASGAGAGGAGAGGAGAGGAGAGGAGAGGAGAGGGGGGGGGGGTPGESAHGGTYIQVIALGGGFMDFPNFLGLGVSYSWTGFRPDIEFGFHPSGRHDGFVLGLRQAFTITGVQGAASGTSQVRLGWDIPIALGSHELSLDPFAVVGVGYFFDGPSAGVVASGGIDAKFFVAGGFYAFARPAELGVQCFHDYGVCAFALNFGAGVGFAIGD
jgi:hypothetical protein